MKRLLVVILTPFILSCASDLRVTPLPDHRYEISVTGGDLAAGSSYDKWLAQKAAQLCPGYKVLSTNKEWSPFDSGVVSKTRNWTIECPATTDSTSKPRATPPEKPVPSSPVTPAP
jgi:hypothetical protein